MNTDGTLSHDPESLAYQTLLEDYKHLFWMQERLNSYLYEERDLHRNVIKALQKENEKLQAAIDCAIERLQAIVDEYGVFACAEKNITLCNKTLDSL